jgi:FAD/FMN-containing dehydrogenase
MLEMIEGAVAEVSDEAVENLRQEVRGAVLTQSDGDYGHLRTPFNVMHSDRPALAVLCRGTADVVAAVNFARERQIQLTVRGGGHSVAGLSSTDGGMLLDLSGMRGVDVDPDARVARVQGGAVLGDVDHETQAFGLAAPLGVVSETGVAGLTLGGGYGWLRRKHGLACDNVLSAQVVCADGSVRTASRDVNPDLFWGIRGGGGNFGVVTSLTLRLHSLGPTVAFAGVFYPAKETAAILHGYREYFERAGDEVSTEALAITMPADPHLPEAIHDQECFVVAGVYSGDADEGMTALQPLRELAEPLADISQPMPYTAVQSAFDGFFPRSQLRSYWKAVYLPELPDEVIEIVARRAQDRPSWLDIVDVYSMGGAIARLDPDETAFAQRSAPWMALVMGNWSEATHDDEQIAWVRETWAEISAFGSGTYLNFVGLADEPRDTSVDDAFGRNLQRLAEVKAKYDPENFFRRNNNIAPIGASSGYVS